MANAELVAKIKKYINEKHKHLDIFTEQQLIDYLLGKAKGNEKNFKLDNFNFKAIIKHLQGKHNMSYDLIIESAERLAKRYASLSKKSSGPKPEVVGSFAESALTNLYIKGAVSANPSDDGSTIQYKPVRPVKNELDYMAGM